MLLQSTSTQLEYMLCWLASLVTVPAEAIVDKVSQLGLFGNIHKCELVLEDFLVGARAQK